MNLDNIISISRVYIRKDQLMQTSFADKLKQTILEDYIDDVVDFSTVKIINIEDKDFDFVVWIAITIGD